MLKKNFPHAHNLMQVNDARPHQNVSLLLRTPDGQAFYKREQLQFKKSQLYAMSHVPGFHALPRDAQSKIMEIVWE